MKNQFVSIAAILAAGAMAACTDYSTTCIVYPLAGYEGEPMEYCLGRSIFGAISPTYGISFMDSSYNTTKVIGSYKCGDRVQMQVCQGVPKSRFNSKTKMYEYSCTQSILDETELPGEEVIELGFPAGGLVLILDQLEY